MITIKGESGAWVIYVPRVALVREGKDLRQEINVVRVSVKTLLEAYEYLERKA